MHPNRLAPPGRVIGIDLARGLAVIGMMAAHLSGQPTLEWSDPATWGGIVHGRSSILFATLAGVSVALTTRPGPRLLTTRIRLAQRALIIWALGLALTALPLQVAVILPAYGVLFLIACFLIGWSTRALALLAGGLTLVMPFVVSLMNAVIGDTAGFVLFLSVAWWYPFPVWAAFLVGGMVVGRFLVDVTSRPALARRGVVLFGVGTALAVLGYAVVGPLSEFSDSERLTELQGLAVYELNAVEHGSGLGEVIGSGGFAVAVIGLCLLVGLTPARWVLWPLRAVGSMPLTAYTAHLLLWVAWAELVDRPGHFAVATAIVVIGCSAWALFLGRGPAEWAIGRIIDALRPRPKPAGPT